MYLLSLYFLFYIISYLSTFLQMFLIISRTFIFKEKYCTCFFKHIKAKNRDEKSPLFFNYKICTKQLPKFFCKRTPHPSACGCHLPSSRRGLQEHCVHSQISHWRRLNEPPLCKGSSAAGGEGLFFYNPSRRRLQVCFAHSQIPPTAARFPNPSRRGLQACFAHLQIPLHKGA